ncbi:MAG: RHS repeat-associated core domain-containing protein [Candidatus Woesearchaeota archaeon]|nr:MAG: RHS repeat-associated core domain-containing protein [Candidatus Woesearchaeota archaeon]
MGRFVVFPLVVGLVALVGVLLLFVGRFDFDGSGRAFSVDVLSPSSDVDVSDELVVGKSHVDASSVGDGPLDGSLSKEVVDDVVVKEDGVGVVKNDVVKKVVDSLDSDDGVVDDNFGFDDVDVGVRSLSFPVVTRFVPGVGELRNGKLSFRHSDRLSSVRLKTAANTAQVTGEFLSLPFGQELVSTNSRLSFATEKELDESGLYFFGARYYDPNIGRFTGVDPVRSNHAYSYVNNNPMNYVDPDGKEPNKLDLSNSEKLIGSGRFGIVAATSTFRNGLPSGVGGAWVRDNGDVTRYLTSGLFEFRDLDFKKIFGEDTPELRAAWSGYVQEKTMSIGQNSCSVETSCAGFGFYLIADFAIQQGFESVSFSLEKGGVDTKGSGSKVWIKIFERNNALLSYSEDKSRFGNYHVMLDPSKLKESWFLQGPLASTVSFDRNTVQPDWAAASDLSVQEILDHAIPGTVYFEEHQGTWGHATFVFNPSNDVMGPWPPLDN